MKNVWNRIVTLTAAACLILAALSGCHSESADSSGADSRMESTVSAETADTELTITAPYVDRNVGIAALAREFERLHPGTKVSVEAGIPDNKMGDANAWNHFIERLVTRLLSGDAPDILVDPGVLNPKKYADNGLAYDLYEWMDADPEFQKEDYYGNLFQAMEYQGHLYTLPANFSLDVLYLNKNITDALGVEFQPWDTIDYKAILSLYDRAAEQELLAEDFTLEFMDQKGRMALFLPIEFPGYLNETLNSAKFDSPEFVRYLEETKRIPSKRLTTDGITSITGGNILQAFADSNTQENTSLLLLNVTMLEGLTELAEPAEGCSGPLILTAGQGSASFYADLPLTVPVSCKNPKLAWEFLKFAIAPVEKPAYSELYVPEGGADILHGALPVGRKNMRSFGKLYAQAKAAAEAHPGFWMDNFNPSSVPCPLDDAFFDQLDRVAGSYTTAHSRYGNLEKIIQPILTQYYDTDTLAAEECARKIQEKAMLFLNE